jgi:hypothetical protein
MLPGFRFLLAAILLSTSILVFGLGAASLLRASHEQYVSNPSWRNGLQEQMFTQASEPAQPVLTALRVEPVANEATPAMQDQIPSIGLPAVETGPEQMAAVTLEAKAQPQVAAIAPVLEAAPPAPVVEPAKSEAASPAPADTLTPADTTAAITTKTPAPEVPRTATVAPASRVTDIAAARMAALNELAPAKTRADSATAKPRANKPKKRRRIVRRPPPQQINQALDPFGQPQQTLATTATRTR